MIEFKKKWQGYGLSFALVLGWWALAFFPHASKNESLPKNFTETTPHLSHVTPINRTMLQKALSGDVPLMTRLIADWDLDAQLLQINGHKKIRRLPSCIYLRSQILGRQLAQKKKVGGPKILPQTFVSASFALALASPEQLIALPTGLRLQTNLFPTSTTQRIPHDIDRYNAETLFLAHPEIAFVTHYSHPAIVTALKNQGVKTVQVEDIETVRDIQNNLRELGQLIERPLEANLLSIFMDAALIAIDNCLASCEEAYKKPALFLYHNTHFSVPTKHTLTGQLLERTGVPIALPLPQRNEWMVPVTKEQLIAQNPALLIVAAKDIQMLRSYMYNDSALQNLRALQNDSVFFIEESVQQFPSQYIVLAYYDIVHAILGK